MAFMHGDEFFKTGIGRRVLIHYTPGQKRVVTPGAKPFDIHDTVDGRVVSESNFHITVEDANSLAVVHVQKPVMILPASDQPVVFLPDHWTSPPGTCPADRYEIRPAPEIAP